MAQILPHLGPQAAETPARHSQPCSSRATEARQYGASPPTGPVGGGRGRGLPVPLEGSRTFRPSQPTLSSPCHSELWAAGGQASGHQHLPTPTQASAGKWWLGIHTPTSEDPRSPAPQRSVRLPGLPPQSPPPAVLRDQPTPVEAPPSSGSPGRWAGAGPGRTTHAGPPTSAAPGPSALAPGPAGGSAGWGTPSRAAQVAAGAQRAGDS